MMGSRQFLRVVALRKGNVRPVEFRLREGETGLSLFLFAHRQQPSPEDICAAVRAAGKQGDLAVAIVREEELRELGLIIARTAGGTPAAEVNKLHYEARLPRWRKVLLALRGIPSHEFFNEHYSQRLHDRARLLDEEPQSGD